MITKKLMATEFWASLQWLFIIPAARIGNKFLSAAQLGLASFVFDFLGQIVTDIFTIIFGNSHSPSHREFWLRNGIGKTCL